jgi:hypothetical protein
VAIGTRAASTAATFAVYEYELRAGERYRNAELHTVPDSQVTQVQVFFGGRVS